nr:MAG TPA: hypothetical protein [Caudoviricetes sp.]
MRALCPTWPEGCILCCPTVCCTAQLSPPFSVAPTGLSCRQGLRRTQSGGSAAWRLHGCGIGMR